MREDKKFLTGLAWKENIDIYCEALLKEFARVSGESFFDPGLEHLWIKDDPDDHRSGCAIYVSQEFWDKLAEVGLGNYNYDGPWAKTG